MLFSTWRRASITWCPQPAHFNLKSAPTRRISHSRLPQGCGFFNLTISPTSYSYPICTAYFPLQYIMVRFSYRPQGNPHQSDSCRSSCENTSPMLPVMTRSAIVSRCVGVLLISTRRFPR